MGSFWDHPLKCTDNADLFEIETNELKKNLRELPRNCAVRKINELVKRIRLLKVHAYIISYLKEQMPTYVLKDRKKKQVHYY